MNVGERLFLAVATLFVFLPGLAARDLWNPDEPRYAEVAREMRSSGEWLVPQFNGRTSADKPPLFFWAISLCSALPGVSPEAATRLPSLLAATATVLLLFDLARRLFDRRVALWSALVFLSSVKILWQGRIGQIDMLLVALVTAAMHSFVRGLLENRPRFYRLFFLFAGLATLAKGPVGLLPPLLAIVVWALASGRTDILRDLRIPTGLLLWLAVVSVWLVPAGLAGGREYLETIVWRQNITRFVDPWHHFQPWHYYLTTIVADFFPWSLFLPGAIWVGAKRVGGEARLGFGLALSWMLVTLLFFSLSPAKRTVYILTMYPAMALLVAVSFAEIEASWERLRRWLVVPAALLATFLTLLPVAGYLGVRFFPELLAADLERLAPVGSSLIPQLALLAVILAIAAQAALLAARRGSARRTVLALAAGFGTAAVLAATLLLPRFDAVKSARPLSQRLLALAAPDEPYAIWPRLDAPFLFYTRRFAVELATADELRAFAARPTRVWLLIERDALARLGELPLAEVAHDDRSEDGYALLTNRPPSARAPR